MTLLLLPGCLPREVGWFLAAKSFSPTASRKFPDASAWSPSQDQTFQDRTCPRPIPASPHAVRCRDSGSPPRSRHSPKLHRSPPVGRLWHHPGKGGIFTFDSASRIPSNRTSCSQESPKSYSYTNRNRLPSLGRMSLIFVVVESLYSISSK